MITSKELVSQRWIIYHGPVGFKIGCSAFVGRGEGAISLRGVIAHLPN